MKYISLFSGIEAATVAWQPLGWKPVAFSEIEKFPSAVLTHRFPSVPNLGDITKIDWSNHGAVDLVVGGSPCQSFSLAGKREGLCGESRLMYEYLRAIRELMPLYFVWENVPGALSSERGDAFRQFLQEVDELGYGVAWRILDAQFFGVAQRRRRLFVVGCLGDQKRPAEILFNGKSMFGHTKTSREKREELTPYSKKCSREYMQVVMASDRVNTEIEYNVSTTIVADRPPMLITDSVRRLMPIECERLMGFPDEWTRIPWRGKPAEDCPDTPRYKALGNSIAVPVIRWIGERIDEY